MHPIIRFVQGHGHSGATTGALAIVALAVATATALAADEPRPRSGKALYNAACAACHGADGKGAPRSQVGFDEPLPDFTDCSFATREPNADWIGVVHEGGPVRGFSRMMPAFGDALTLDEMQRVMAYVRGFCGDDDWPRGELNLPRPLVTTKAYPEDELVITSSVAVEGPTAVSNELIYEQRFGARNQFEVIVPFGFREEVPAAGGEWRAALGDLGFALKRALYHDHERGHILSAGAEAFVPTGDEDKGFGAGTTRFEPFVAFGQILPGDGFVHFQGGFELPVDTDEAEQESFVRAALGRSFVQGRFGRTWSPMVEVLGARELRDGADFEWDLAPQFQVTLNTRQHVRLNVGARVPVNDTAGRDTRVMVYLLWDWFDGGFFEGW